MSHSAYLNAYGHYVPKYLPDDRRSRQAETSPVQELTCVRGVGEKEYKARKMQELFRELLSTILY